MFIILAILIIIVSIIYLKTRKKLVCELPGPKAYPIVGNAFIFLKDDPLYVVNREKKTHGTLFQIWLGADLYVIMSDPKEIEVILSSYKYTTKSSSYRFLHEWLKNGLITSDGGTWHRHRKFLTPTFHFKILENSIGIINKNANIFAQQLRSQISEDDFNVHALAEKCSLDIICEVAMDLQMNSQTAVSSEDERYFNAVKTVTHISTERIFKWWLQPNIFFKVFGNYDVYQRALEIIENVSKNVISSKRKKILEDNDEEKVNVIDTDSKKKSPFLDSMLKEGNFTDEEIRDEVMSFLFAGHDTTTSGLSFCLYQLSLEQDIQDKVYQEIVEVLPRNECPNIQQINNLKYTEMVIKETLRIYPPVPMLGRTLLEDVTLPDGRTLPADSQVNIFIYGMHHDPALFPEPEKFIPERFNSENSNERHPFSYIPFSAGPRNCIGSKLAMIELKMVLATILTHYKILPAEKGIKLAMKIILKSQTGIPIRIVERK